MSTDPETFDDGEATPGTNTPGFGFENGERVQTVPFPFNLIDGQPEESALSLGQLLRSGIAAEYFGRAFALKMAVLDWMIRPADFGGISLSELARRNGVSPAMMSKYASQVSRLTGIRNRSQRTSRKTVVKKS